MQQESSKIRIGVLYGGRSGEHDVSLCSAASAVSALNTEKYEIIAIGIDRDGKWYVQDKPEIVPHKDFGKVLSLKKRGTWLVNHFEEGNKLSLYNLNIFLCCLKDNFLRIGRSVYMHF